MSKKSHQNHPYKPAGLSEFESDLYDKIIGRLIEINYNPELDEQALLAYLRHSRLMHEANEALLAHGVLIDGRHGPVLNPAHQVYRQNSESALRWARVLGLSAHSRKQIGVAPPEKLDDDELY